jgi:hypothetical protein
VTALFYFREAIQTQCCTDTPELTDANLKSALFFHFNTGTSGISITHFRPKNMSKLSTLMELYKILGIASSVYGFFFGAHITRGFQQLQSDLLIIHDHCPGSLTVPAAIQLVDRTLAALRKALFYDPEAPYPSSSALDAVAATAMSIKRDHPMVVNFHHKRVEQLIVDSDKVKKAAVVTDPAHTGRADTLRKKRSASPPTDASLRTSGGQRVELDWDNRPVITGVAPCFSWASKTGHCRSAAENGVCLGKSPFPHSWDSATSEAERVAFLAWLSGH